MKFVKSSIGAVTLEHLTPSQMHHAVNKPVHTPMTKYPPVGTSLLLCWGAALSKSIYNWEMIRDINEYYMITYIRFDLIGPNMINVGSRVIKNSVGFSCSWQ